MDDIESVLINISRSLNKSTLEVFRYYPVLKKTHMICESSDLLDINSVIMHNWGIPVKLAIELEYIGNLQKYKHICKRFLRGSKRELSSAVTWNSDDSLLSEIDFKETKSEYKIRIAKERIESKILTWIRKWKRKKYTDDTCELSLALKSIGASLSVHPKEVESWIFWLVKEQWITSIADFKKIPADIWLVWDKSQISLIPWKVRNMVKTIPKLSVPKSSPMDIVLPSFSKRRKSTSAMGSKVVSSVSTQDTVTEIQREEPMIEETQRKVEIPWLNLSSIGAMFRQEADPKQEEVLASKTSDESAELPQEPEQLITDVSPLQILQNRLVADFSADVPSEPNQYTPRSEVSSVVASSQFNKVSVSVKGVFKDVFVRSHASEDWKHGNIQVEVSKVKRRWNLVFDPSQEVEKSRKSVSLLSVNKLHKEEDLCLILTYIRKGVNTGPGYFHVKCKSEADFIQCCRMMRKSIKSAREENI
jgi:hypothetical protein